MSLLHNCLCALSDTNCVHSTRLYFAVLWCLSVLSITFLYNVLEPILHFTKLCMGKLGARPKLKLTRAQRTVRVRYGLEAIKSLTLCRLGDVVVILNVIFTLVWWIGTLSVIWKRHVNATKLHWWCVNTASGNGLALSGDKPLPESVSTKISDKIRCH